MIGINLRAERLKRCLSLRRAASLMRVSKSTLHRYENKSSYSYNCILNGIMHYYGFHNYKVIENKLYVDGGIKNESKIKSC